MLLQRRQYCSTTELFWDQKLSQISGILVVFIKIFLVSKRKILWFVKVCLSERLNNFPKEMHLIVHYVLDFQILRFKQQFEQCQFELNF